MTDDTCLNCTNKVTHDSVFCSEKCQTEWDVKKYETQQEKIRVARKRRKTLGAIAGGLILVLAILVGSFFYPQYELGVLQHDEHYPRTIQVEDCAVTYDIKDGNVIFPINLVCDTHPNQTKADRLVVEINNISDILNKELLQNHPELKQEITSNVTK